jgi:hypothetical protein
VAEPNGTLLDFAADLVARWEEAVEAEHRPLQRLAAVGGRLVEQRCDLQPGAEPDRARPGLPTINLSG